MVLVTEGQIMVNEKSLKNGDMVHLSTSGSDILLSSYDVAKVLIMS